MKNLLVKYYNGNELTLDEVVRLLNEYMRVMGKTDNTIIQNMLKSPMAQQLFQKALHIAAERLKEDYTITTVYSKEGQKLIVF